MIRRILFILVFLGLGFVGYRFFDPDGADNLLDRVKESTSGLKFRNKSEIVSGLGEDGLYVTGTTIEITKDDLSDTKDVTNAGVTINIEEGTSEEVIEKDSEEDSVEEEEKSVTVEEKVVEEETVEEGVLIESADSEEEFLEDEEFPESEEVETEEPKTEDVVNDDDKENSLEGEEEPVGENTKDTEETTESPTEETVGNSEITTEEESSETVQQGLSSQDYEEAKGLLNNLVK